MELHLPKTLIRLVAFTVVFAMLASLVPTIGQKASAATVIKNPRISNNTVTWDCVWFGHYPQSSDGKGGFSKDPIKWRVLSVKGDEALLLADKSLDIEPYNKVFSDITWETCTIRSWLNGYNRSQNKCGKDYTNNNFLSTAFTNAEQKFIYQKTIKNTDNSEYGTKGGIDTRDKVFLLSIEEARTVAYGFPNHIEETATRKAVNTAYAANKDWKSKEGECQSWWLRSAGISAKYVINVLYNGAAYHPDCDISFPYTAVRPALRLNLKSNVWQRAGSVSSNGTKQEIPYKTTGTKKLDSKQKPNLQKVILKKVKSTKRGTLKLTWKRDKKVTGYQAVVATDKKFKKNKKIATSKKNNTVTKTFTKLKRKKTYYAQVRAYKQMGKTKVYGSYSKVKKAKVK